MKEIDFIEEVEKNYSVSSIKANGIQIWPILRNAYGFAFYSKYHPLGSNKTTRVKIKRIANSFYGIANMAGKFEYLFSSDSLEVRMFEGGPINKIMDASMKKAGKKKCLLIENPRPRHPIGSRGEKVVSLDLFRILSLIHKKKVKMENADILEAINYKYALYVDYRALVAEFFGLVRVFKFFLDLKSPKAVFVSNYFNVPNQALVYVAKERKIPTVEYQHGSIDKNSIPYNVFYDLDKKTIPEYLFVFGEKTKGMFDSEERMWQKEKIFAIGNDYLTQIRKTSPERAEFFKGLRKKYDVLIAVTSQDPIEKKILDFITVVANNNKKNLFIFVPRTLPKFKLADGLPENIKVLWEFNAYEIMSNSDIHATVYSSCALEAPAFGVPNILIDIDGLAKEYYSGILTDRKVTQIVASEKEFNKAVEKFKGSSKKEIISRHKGFYTTGKGALEKAIDKFI